mgnify:CR=1 FL=1
MDTPKAVILVGGEGTRLRPLTLNTHKCMVPIINRPFLEHLLSNLRKHGVREVVFALCHLHNQIVDHFGDGSAFGMKLHYVVEDTPLGTAGAVRNAERFLDGTFFVLNGDVYTDLDLTALLKLHKRQSAMATIALTYVEDTRAFGVVETAESGRVMRFLEKPQPGVSAAKTVNAGTYVLEPQTLALIPRNQPYMFEHGLFPTLLKDGQPVYGYPSSCYWMDIGTPQRYLDLNQHLLRCEPMLGSYSHLQNIRRDGGYNIHPLARVRGPVLLGQDCHVGAGAEVIGPTVLGPGCYVEAGARVISSVLWPGARVES